MFVDCVFSPNPLIYIPPWMMKLIYIYYYIDGIQEIVLTRTCNQKKPDN